MQCPQCADFLRPEATICRECGWGEPAPESMTPPRRDRPAPAAWSPPVPKFLDEPWRSQRRMTPAEVAPYLAELKAKLGAVNGGPVNQVDPALEARRTSEQRPSSDRGNPATVADTSGRHRQEQKASLPNDQSPGPCLAAPPRRG
jgi:hypothetical protein